MQEKSINESMKPRLLIVDDDEMMSRTVELIARREGFDVRMTGDPERFLELVGEWQPSVVAIDLVMPHMDGVQILNELAKRKSEARVIIASGVDLRVLDAARRSAREQGLNIVGILPKPFSPPSVRLLLGACTGAPAIVDEKKPWGDDTAGPVIDMQALEQALEKHQFFMFYQPKVHCADGALAGMEALVRWRHPQAGIVGPADFIALFEASELMGELNRQVLDEALAWFASLDAQVVAEAGLTLSLNVSTRSLEDDIFVERLNEDCSRFGIEPGRVNLELTETSAMKHPARSLDLLTRLRLMGFQLSIDDFGTGYSSMLQLVRLPFSEVKVDRSFVMAAQEPGESRNVVRSIVELGKALGLKTTAEGIESQAVMDYLRLIGCDYGQGYHISRPQEGDRIRKEWGL